MICEKCGFETGPSARFCSICGTPVVPVQQPEPAPQQEIDLVPEDACPVVAEVAAVEEVPAVDEALFEEVAAVDTVEVEAVEPEVAEIPVYNSEMSVPEVPEEEAPAEEAPVAPAFEIPAPVSAEPAAESIPVAPVYPGVPMYGVPTGQTYNGVPVYAVPNPQYYNAPNGSAYNPAPNGQVYPGAPVYPPVYNAAPGYGVPNQAYPGAPVYGAPMPPMYAPQAAPGYASGYYGAEPAAAPKTVSILALLGSIAAIVALFLSLFGYTEMSMVKLISEELQNIIDSFEYIDILGSVAYLTIAAVAICILCVVFAAIVFLLVLLKKKCRGTAIFSMLLPIAFAAVFVFLRAEASYYWVEVDFEFIMDAIEDLGVGFWLYLGGMLVAAIGGGKR